MGLGPAAVPGPAANAMPGNAFNYCLLYCSCHNSALLHNGRNAGTAHFMLSADGMLVALHAAAGGMMQPGAGMPSRPFSPGAGAMAGAGAMPGPGGMATAGPLPQMPSAAGNGPVGAAVGPAGAGPLVRPGGFQARPFGPGPAAADARFQQQPMGPPSAGGLRPPGKRGFDQGSNNVFDIC